MESHPPVRGRFTAAAVSAAVVLTLASSVVATGYDQPGTASFADTLSFAFALAALVVVGAVIMRERAEELGGAVTVADAAPGVRVEARLPAATAPPRVSPAPVTRTVPA